MFLAKATRSLFRFVSRHGRHGSTPATVGLQGIRLWMLSLLFLLSGSQAIAGQVTLQWNAVTHPQLAGYKVYYGYASRQYSTNVNVGTSTTAAFSSLKDAQKYYFAVTAFTSGKESAFSNEVVYDLAAVDTDKDGLSDWEEINLYRTNPDRADSDGDGLSDGDEVNRQTDPNKADSDGDGFSDGIEVSRGSNPLDAGSLPAPGAAVFAVNAGGPQYTAVDGTVFAADAQFSGGRTDTKTAAIAGTADDSLYQSWRYGNSNFSYTVPVANGAYLVTLKFADNLWSQAGQRVFDVTMESKVVLSKLDVVAKVGLNAAYDVTVPVTVADSKLNIGFKAVVGNPMVSGIKVEPREVVFAVNAGGPAYVDAAGEVYEADAAFSGGTVWTTTAAIAGTEDDRLYQSERYGDFSYNVPVDNGDYEVTLKFAEIYWTTAGQRIFNVLIEGQTVISNLDLVAKAGPNTAYDVVVPVTVADGVLNIAFQRVVNAPKINAIKIVAK